MSGVILSVLSIWLKWLLQACKINSYQIESGKTQILYFKTPHLNFIGGVFFLAVGATLVAYCSDWRSAIEKFTYRGLAM